jgi:hypothetical protein
MRPTGAGGTASVEYDFSNQNRNWSGTSRAPSSANDDKQIRTDFLTAGAQYMFDRAWGATIELPVWNRRFRTYDAGASAVDTFDHAALGDVRLMGVYSGFSPDMASGVMFGVKLPTGPFHTPGFDRDTAIGSGSTDLLLGAYHQGNLCSSGAVAYFVQGLLDLPLAHQGPYTPGQEFDGAGGVYYNGFGRDGPVRFAPVLQLILSTRARDRGADANPDNSGYTRLLLSPGLEFDGDDWKFYADVELPVYQRVNGDQLIARQLFKVVVSRDF